MRDIVEGFALLLSGRRVVSEVDMTESRLLSQAQINNAVDYNRRRHGSGPYVSTLRQSVGLSASGGVDGEFIRAVADWQEYNVGKGTGDGLVGPKTEASLNVLHPKARAAAEKAIKLQTVGFTLFDSWGNDLRDNNLDGTVDDSNEASAHDGAHYGRSYPDFKVTAGVYTGGWNFLPQRTVIVGSSRTIHGPFVYRVCADIVSEAYRNAGVMDHQRSTLKIFEQFKAKGYVFRRSESYPSKYLPGDFICTLEKGEGHSGIIINEGDTRGGAEVPIVIQLPGPSTQISDGTYNPETTNDITRGPWSRWRIDRLPTDVQYLCRLIHSKLPF